MVKHTQQFVGKSRRMFQCVWPFCRVGAQRVKGLRIFISVRYLFYSRMSHTEEYLGLLQTLR